jgi:hypothetical protein
LLNAVVALREMGRDSHEWFEAYAEFTDAFLEHDWVFVQQLAGRLYESELDGPAIAAWWRSADPHSTLRPTANLKSRKVNGLFGRWWDRMSGRRPDAEPQQKTSPSAPDTSQTSSVVSEDRRRRDANRERERIRRRRRRNRILFGRMEHQLAVEGMRRGDHLAAMSHALHAVTFRPRNRTYEELLARLLLVIELDEA